jgi:Fe-S-cluster containining protein
LWEESVTPIAANIERLESIQEKVLFGRETLEEKQLFYSDLSEYASLQIPCPFLRDGACAIYPVRPYSCACILSTSPRTWCDRNNLDRQKKTIYRKNPNRGVDPRYMGLAESIIFGCLPSLVYQILNDGYNFISSFQGLEGLKEEAADDPQVQNILRLIQAA